MAVGAILGQRGIQSVNGVQSDTTGNVDLSAGTMTSGIDMNSQALTGLTTPVNPQDSATKQYVDNNSSPYNWLDNSDFRYPVAQAGVGGNHGTQAYAVDRWILTSGSVSHTAGVGLTLNGTITQKLEHSPAGAVSAFVGMASGQASISYRGGAVTITSAGGIVAWAALYDGTYTEQTKPEYRPKGYGVELAECQRYYRILDLRGAEGFLSDENTALFNIGFLSMRVDSPTVIILSADNVVSPEGYFPILTSGASITNRNCLVLQVNNTISLPVHTPVGVFACYITLSADL